MAKAPERAGVVRDPATGEMIIPASQRPDGTWRKARRVKDGYIPQEEVPTFQTKGSQWRESKPDHPIGLSKEDVAKLKKVKEAQIEASTNAAVRAKSGKNKKKPQKEGDKNKSSIESVSKEVAGLKLAPAEENSKELTQEDIGKKIKGLKKKLRQVEELEAKISSGEIKVPNEQQTDKINKKQSFLDEIKDLESKQV